MSETTPPRSKPVIDHKVEVTVTGLTDEVTTTALADPGASRSCIDRSLAVSIGVGPLVAEKTFRSGTGDSESRLVVALTIEIEGEQYDVEASLADRSTLSTDVRLGRDVVNQFLVEVADDP